MAGTGRCGRRIFGDEQVIAHWADQAGMAIRGGYFKLIDAQRGMTERTDNTNHGGLLEYCNSIQSLERRNTVCLSNYGFHSIDAWCNESRMGACVADTT